MVTPEAAAESTPAKKVTKHRTTKAKAAAAPKTAPAKKIAKPKATKAKSASKAPIKAKAIKVEAAIEAPQVEEIKEEKTPLQKGIEAGKTTRKIIKKAGAKILGSSIQTTQALAGIYKEAGKKVIELGKEVFEDTVKAVGQNQKAVRNASTKAFKETVETIKETNLIENPLKKIRKSK